MHGSAPAIAGKTAVTPLDDATEIPSRRATIPGSAGKRSSPSVRFFRLLPGWQRPEDVFLILHPTVNGTLALTVPHSMRNVAPRAVSSIEIVNCSTGLAVLPTVMGALPSSSAGWYGMPH